jgi:uncharacterized OsmC-like protein
MDAEGIRRSIEAAAAYLTEHPEEAAYSDSVAVARVEQGLRVRVEGPNGESVVTDMPSSVGGDGSAPSAGWLFRASVAACVATLVAMRAAHRAVEVGDVEVTVDSESDDRGILGLDQDVPAGPRSMRIAVRAATAHGAEARQVEGAVRWAVAHCPVSEAVGRAVPVRLEIEAR